MSSPSEKFQPNQEFTCPICGFRSIAREEKIVEGLFEVVGNRYVCSSCGWEIPADQLALPNDKTDHSHFHRQSPQNTDATWETLFGAPSSPVVAEGLTLENDLEHFCKCCSHYLESPFSARCLLTKQEVEPLGFCQHFSQSNDA